MVDRKRLAPGVETDEDGTLHLSFPDLLRAAGYDDTPENRRTLERAAVELFGAGGAEVEVVD